MASSKGPVRAHINQAVRTAFPPTRVAALQQEGSLYYELELWLELAMEAVPSQWWRDWEAMSFKYALAALAGEGVAWEPRHIRRVYTGDLALCQVGGIANERFRRSGGYGGRNGRVPLSQWYLPEQVTTAQQGDGEAAVVNGELRRISWPVHEAQLPEHLREKPWAFSDEEIMGERPF
jgi:hypothetical protein